MTLPVWFFIVLLLLALSGPIAVAWAIHVVSRSRSTSRALGAHERSRRLP